MKNRVIWSQIAVTQLREIKEYISHESLKNSTTIYQNIIYAIKKLELFPKIGIVIDVNSQFRVIIVSKYKISYHVQNNEVIILSIYHTAKKFDVDEINHTFKNL